jgi:hypothetical protein
LKLKEELSLKEEEWSEREREYTDTQKIINSQQYKEME